MRYSTVCIDAGPYRRKFRPLCFSPRISHSTHLLQETDVKSAYQRWRSTVAAAALALALLACGGGGSSNSGSAAALAPAPETGAPALVNDAATDGLNWINYRRVQSGMPPLEHSAVIDRAAQGHSNYQKANDTVTHEQSVGLPGFTGVDLLARLTAAAYLFNSNTGYAYGEVISATSSTSGVYMTEELITAIYHRFVIFEPQFKEIGTGVATTASGYSYFTSDFAANNGYGPGLGRGKIAGWPFEGQAKVPTNFFSDNESPDPVAGLNEVGYPVSVHADFDAILGVASFTLRPRGGAELAVKLLKNDSDVHTPRSAAAIVPLAVLKAGTTYDVTFNGTIGAVAVSKSWSFTTK
jgi:uncharacterized protein YkwD